MSGTRELDAERQSAALNREVIEGELLRAAARERPSADVILEAERALPWVSGDAVRCAYWALVSSGRLDRTISGARVARRAIPKVVAG